MSLGVLKDNHVHRALFSLPPIKPSASAELVVPEMPTQKVVTGDLEIDAVLWLREVIGTGNADLIAKAKAAATRIKTPLNELEKRYRDYLSKANPGNWVAALSSFGFADLDGLATSATTRCARRREAEARFGATIFDDTPAEQFCEQALKRVKRSKDGFSLDEDTVDKRFDARPENNPSTLTDCIAELTYWTDLYWLRDAVGGTGSGDGSMACHARQDYVFRMLSRIPRRSAEEAAEVFRYLASNDGMDREHTGAIILNLIGAPEPYKAKQGDAA